MLHVVTVAFRDPPTNCVLAAWTSHTAKFVKDIWKTTASIKYSTIYARYIYKSYYFYTLPSCVFYILYKLDYYLSLSLHVVSSVCYRTVKNDAPVCEQTSETIWALVALLATVIVGVIRFRKVERNAQ